MARPLGRRAVPSDVPVANSNSGNGNLRPETFNCTAANEPRRRSKILSRPTAAALSRGNVALFCGGGNHELLVTVASCLGVSRLRATKTIYTLNMIFAIHNHELLFTSAKTEGFVPWTDDYRAR